MRFELEALLQARAERQSRVLQKRVGRLPLRRRLDPVWWSLARRLVLTLTAILIGGVLLWEVNGGFEPDLLRPVPDRRRLLKIRDHLAKRPLLAATVHDQRLWLSQTAGLLHRYDPATELWSQWGPLRQYLPLRGEAVALGEPCGREMTAAGFCGADPSLWLRGEHGGLAVYRDRRWTAIFGEHPALDRDGKPLDSKQLRAAAWSDDGEWLLLGGLRGLGLYRQRDRSWILLPKDLYEEIGFVTVQELRYWQGSFWVGGDGLARLTPGEPPEAEQIPDLDGEVADLEIEDGSLWILQRRRCVGGAKDCSAISRLRSASSSPERLLWEGQPSSELDLPSIRFADQQDDVLTLAGSAGVQTYDVARHTWRQLDDLRVRSVLQPSAAELIAGGQERRPRGSGLDLAAAVRVRNHQIQDRWELPGGKVEGLTEIDGRQILARTDQGKIFRLTPESEPQPAFEATASELEPEEFSHAVAAGDHVVFFGPEGGLLHDTRQRTYDDLMLLNDWAKRPDAVAASGRTVFVVDRQAGASQVYGLPIDTLVAGDFRDLGTVPGTVRRLADWNRQGLGLLNDRGGVYFAPAAGDKVRSLLGPPLPDLTTAQIRDVVLRPNLELLLATDQGLLSYLYSRRGWDGEQRLRGVGGGLRQVETAADLTLFRTANHQLGWLDRRGGHDFLIGSEDPWPTDLRDALVDGDRLFLAATDQVVRYDPRHRRIDWPPWNLARRGVDPRDDRLRLVTILDRPVTFAPPQLFVGEEPIVDAAGDVEEVFTDDTFLWTVRVKGGQKYLRGHPRRDPLNASASRCFFQSPKIDARKVFDIAAVAPDRHPGWIVAATDRGLFGYDANHRSWHRWLAPPAAPGAGAGSPLLHGGGRLERLGNYLALRPLSDGSTARPLRLLDTSRLSPPSACDMPSWTLPPGSLLPMADDVLESTVARPADGGPRTLAWLTKDLTVASWRDGRHRNLLSALGSAPQGSDLKHAYLTADHLFFTAGQSVYSYRLQDQRWREHRLAFPTPGERADQVDLSLAPTPIRLTVRSTAGAFYLGSIEPDDVAISLDELLPPKTSRLNSRTPGDLLELFEGSRGWTFLHRDGLAVFNPANHRWLDEVTWPRAGAVELRQAGSRRIVIVDGVWWIEQPRRSESRLIDRFARFEPGQEETRLIDGSSQLWLRFPDGEVQRCQAEASRYGCRTVREPSPRVDPDQVDTAYRSRGYQLLVGSGGTRLFDEVAHREVGLPSDLATVRDFDQVLWAAGRWWLLTSDRQLFSGIPEGSWSRHDADDLWIDDLQRVFKQHAGQWSLWQDGNFQPVEEVPESRPTENTAAARLSDRWRDLRRDLETLAGVSYWDPVTALTATADGLFAERPSGRERTSLTPQLANEATPLRPLSSEWLKWHSATRTFEFTTSSLELPPEEVLVDGRLIFESVEALLTEGTRQLHAANRHGVVTYPGSSCDLSRDGVVFRPNRFDREIVAAHGRFLTRQQTYTAVPSESLGTCAEDGRQVCWRPFGSDKIQVREDDPWTGGVRASLDGKTDNAFARQGGFLWDRRRDLAFDGNRLKISSAAGLHLWNLALEPWTDVDLPIAAGPDPDLETSLDGSLQAGRDGVWKRSVSGRWADAGPPGDGSRFQAGELEARQSQGRIEFSLVRPSGEDPQRFRFLEGAAGIGFTSDRLRAATRHQGQLYLMSDAFFEIGDAPGPIAERRYDETSGDRLISLDLGPDGGPTLFRRSGARTNAGRADAWNGQGFRIGPNPLARRPRASLGPLHFSLEGGRLSTEIELASGVRRPISVNARGFSSDRVQGIGVFQRRLYVQTAAGLQIYAESDLTSSKVLSLTATDFLDIGRGASDVRLGVPRDGRDRFVIDTGQNCWQWNSGTAPPESCAPGSLREMDRGDDALWQWSQLDGTLSGRYKASGVPVDSAVVTLADGRFPHDRLSDLAACGSTWATLRDDGWLSLHRSADLSLNRTQQVRLVDPARPRRLLCLNRSLPRDDGESVSPGLYLDLGSGQTSRFLRWDGSSRPPAVSDDDHEALTRMADDPWIYTRQRLRLADRPARTPRFTFEARSGSRWFDLDWTDGRLPIDDLRHLVFSQRQLWAVTPVGFLDFHLNAAGRLTTDPESWHWVRGPRPEDEFCNVTEIEAREDDLILRCDQDSQKLYAGHPIASPSAPDTSPSDISPSEYGAVGAFLSQEKEEDIFAAGQWIDAADHGIWSWSFEGRSGGRDGTVSVDLHGQKASLVDGRFDFDRLRSVVPTRQGPHLELAAADGWYRAPAGDFHLRRWRRPSVDFTVSPRDVKQIVYMAREGDRVLCVATTNGGFQVTDDQNADAVQPCLESFGDDGFWSYERAALSPTSGPGLEMVAPDRQAKREWIDGRFTDQVAHNLPVAGAEPGSLLVPTRAGVVQWNSDLDLRRVYAQLPGLPEGKPPEVLFTDHDRQPYYLAGQQLHRLADGRAALTLRPAAGTQITGLQVGPSGWLRAHWQTARERGTSLISAAEPTLQAEYSERVDASSWARFKSGRARWGDPSPTLEIRLQDGRGELRHDSGQRYLLPWFGPPHPLAWLPHRESLFVIEPHGIWELRLDVAAAQMFEGRRSDKTAVKRTR